MALIAFQKPENVLMLESTPTHGKFEFKPLEPGYGMTIGNALRRILLSSPEGFAINSIKIDGVEHEFSTIPGVIEDVTNIILNLKKIRIKQVTPGEVEETAVIKVSGKTHDAFTGKEISEGLKNFEVLNKDQLICRLDKSAAFSIQLTIDQGRGWIPASDIAESFDDPLQIAIDAIYTPILNVKISVENTRVGQKTDYDKLTLEVDTDGSIHPKEALKNAAQIMIKHLELFSEENIAVELETEQEEEKFDEATIMTRQLLKNKLEDVDLSVRALNCLRAAGVLTLGDLVKCSRGELLKFRNFGKKSLNEVDELLDHLGLTFGMDVSKYKLDNE
ncbi:MAG: DNA-directed RNA polymerase subunit alpha [Porphyromonas sp.]|nr:DNA-directed RNA polymerase subunit alpha [Porphyromonas sp.]